MFNVCILQVYIKAWFTCQFQIAAPRNDLELFKQLMVYKQANETVALAAITSLSRHLWYLSVTLVGLSLFDSAVPEDIKVDTISTPRAPMVQRSEAAY